MHIINWPRREVKYRYLFLHSEISKKLLRSFLASNFFDFSDRIFFYKSFQKFSFRSSISFFRRSCLVTGHSRSVFRLFKLSRHQAKRFASFGEITGLRKSSF